MRPRERQGRVGVGAEMLNPVLDACRGVRTIEWSSSPRGEATPSGDG